MGLRWCDEGAMLRIAIGVPAGHERGKHVIGISALVQRPWHFSTEQHSFCSRPLSLRILLP